jgi:hypothetical protein
MSVIIRKSKVVLIGKKTIMTRQIRRVTVSIGEIFLIRFLAVWKRRKRNRTIVSAPISVIRVKRYEDEEVKSIFQTGLLFMISGLANVKADRKFPGPTPKNNVFKPLKTSSTINQPK